MFSQCWTFQPNCQHTRYSSIIKIALSATPCGVSIERGWSLHRHWHWLAQGCVLIRLRSYSCNKEQNNNNPRKLPCLFLLQMSKHKQCVQHGYPTGWESLSPTPSISFLCVSIWDLRWLFLSRLCLCSVQWERGRRGHRRHHLPLRLWPTTSVDFLLART